MTKDEKEWADIIVEAILADKELVMNRISLKEYLDYQSVKDVAPISRSLAFTINKKLIKSSSIYKDPITGLYEKDITFFQEETGDKTEILADSFKDYFCNLFDSKNIKFLDSDFVDSKFKYKTDNTDGPYTIIKSIDLYFLNLNNACLDLFKVCFSCGKVNSTKPVFTLIVKDSPNNLYEFSLVCEEKEEQEKIQKILKEVLSEDDYYMIMLNAYTELKNDLVRVKNNITSLETAIKNHTMMYNNGMDMLNSLPDSMQLRLEID